MNIEQAWIQRYGPIQEDLTLGGNIHLIQGPNESGKTLLVEALLKFLIGDGGITDCRVDEQPEGFIVVNGGSGDRKLEQGETLIDYYKDEYNFELSPAELRNIFVIRDADLRIDGEDKFYERVTDRLTGIRTQDIRRVKEELREEGRLTKKRLNISSDNKYDSAGDQVEDARDLKSEIATYLRDEDEVDELESQLLEAKLRKQDLTQEREELEAAKKKNEYQDLVESKETIEENIEQLDDLPDETVVGDVKQDLDQFNEGERDELEDTKDRYSTFTKWSIAGAVVAFGVFLFANAPMIAVAGPLLGFGLAGYFALQMQSASNSIASLDTNRESIVNEAQRIGISADSLGEVRTEVERIQNKREELVREINEEKGALKSNLDIDAEDRGVVVEQAEEELSQMKQGIDTEIDRGFSQSELDQVEEKLGDVKDEIDSLDDALGEHQDALQEFSERAHQLDFRHFTGQPLELQISNLDALEQLVDRLEEFIQEIESDAEISKAAYRLFDRIESSEGEKVAELFGEESKSTELFNRITGDRYRRIRYDHEDNQLIVERTNEQQFTPGELSKGTRDQLYLCIRVALAQELLDMEEGFFIMDDAFLAADGDRLETQADLVEELGGEGWQIIYLTAKQDAVDVLSPLADGDVIELDQLP